MKKRILFIAGMVMSLSGGGSAQEWVNTGGPQSGAILQMIEFDGKLYGRTQESIYVSDDEGSSWTLVGGEPDNIGPNHLAVTSFGVHFISSANRLMKVDSEGSLSTTTTGFGQFDVPTYLVSVEDSLYATTAAGLYKSDDGGENWTNIGSFSSLEVPLEEKGVLYAASLFGGLKVSHDGGITFTELGTELGSAFVTDIVALDDQIAVTSNFGLYYLDEDSVWVQSFNAPGGSGTLAEIDGVIYAIYGALTSDLYASTDSGKTWNQVEFESEVHPVDLGHTRVTDLGGKLYATATAKWTPLVSEDGGLNWEALGTEGIVNPRTNGIFPIGSSVFVTTNDGAGTGQYGDGVFRTDDGGDTWNKVSITLPEGHSGAFNTIRANGPDLYATSTMGLFTSTDDGATWTVVAGTENWYTSDIMFTESNWVLAGGDGTGKIWTSADGGATWTEKLDAIGIQFQRFSEANGNIVIGSLNPLVASSQDNGESFSIADAESGLGGIQFANVAVIDGTFYTFNVNTLDIWTSSDGGATWTKTEDVNGMDGVGTYDRMVSYNGVIYMHAMATTVENGAIVNTPNIYSSTDGANFTLLHEGAEVFPASYMQPQMAFTEEEIYLGYSGSQVYKYSAGGTPAEEEATITNFGLFQNYPNPFNPSTNIGFSISSPGEVSLKVYNLLGQEVAALVSGRLNSGRHTISFDASQLSSGVYIYRLISGGRSQTRKMMLIK